MGNPFVRPSMETTTKHQGLTKFVIWAPDYTDVGALERRLAVRPRHLENAHRLNTEGIIRKYRLAALTENRGLTEA